MVIKPKLNKPDVETTTTFNINEFKQNLEDLKYNINLIRDKSEDFIIDTSGLLNNALDEMNNAYYYFDGLPLQSHPTLSECIKEWNEKGFDVDVYAVEIVIYKPSSVDKEEDEIEISIRIDNKIISYVNDVELSFDLHNLLSKTLKALEEMKDD